MDSQTQFILQNAHFAISLFAAFVFFACFWLYLDAWMLKREAKDSLKFAGFLLLSVSFAIHATALESTILTSPVLSREVYQFLFTLFRVGGYIALALGIVLDPLQKHPHQAFVIIPAGLTFFDFSSFFLPLLSAFVGLLYLRRTSFGLEKHLNPLALAFFALSLSELISQSLLFRTTDNITILQLVSPFGLFWFVEHILLIVVLITLGRWVFGYLLKRIQTQLIMLFSASIMVIFLVTTVTFTFLLLKDLQKNLLSYLSTDVNVLSFAIESMKQSTLSDAEVLAQNPIIQEAIINRDRKTLREQTSSYLLSKKQSLLVVSDSKGEVLMRGEDPEKIGDSLFEDSLVKRAILGEKISTIVTKDAAIAPQVSVRSLVPIRNDKEIIGIVMVGVTIDNSFVDGVKAATTLETAVYANNIRSATTIVAADGKSRYIGIKEESEVVKKSVLDEGKTYTGPVEILNVPYFGAFMALKDVDNNPVGMLFVGREQLSLLQTASKSIQLSFILAVFFLSFSVIPAFLISKYIADQVQ